jgi:hypothetical protein
MTTQQKARMVSVVEDVGRQLMNEAADRIFGGMARRIRVISS